jgi:hypothetical protein
MQSYSLSSNPYPSSTPRVPLELNAELVAWVDELVGYAEGNTDLSDQSLEQQRIEAIESAIQNWCEQQSKRRLQYRADQHRQRHDNDETGWLV